MFKVDLDTLAEIMNGAFEERSYGIYAIPDKRRNVIDFCAQYHTNHPSLVAVVYPDEEKILICTNKMHSSGAKILFEVASDAMEGLHDPDLWDQYEPEIPDYDTKADLIEEDDDE